MSPDGVLVLLLLAAACSVNLFVAVVLWLDTWRNC